MFFVVTFPFLANVTNVFLLLRKQRTDFGISINLHVSFLPQTILHDHIRNIAYSSRKICIILMAYKTDGDITETLSWFNKIRSFKLKLLLSLIVHTINTYYVLIRSKYCMSCKQIWVVT